MHSVNSQVMVSRLNCELVFDDGQSAVYSVSIRISNKGDTAKLVLTDSETKGNREIELHQQNIACNCPPERISDISYFTGLSKKKQIETELVVIMF